MSLRDWLIMAAIAVALLVGFVALLPWVIQGLLRVVLFPRYQMIVRGVENLPKTGPALLAVNHVSWIDGFILAAMAPRRGRALVNASFINKPIFRPLAIWAGIIPVPFSGPRALRASIEASRALLDRGEVLAIFPEAQLTRTGMLGPFFRGLEVILEGRQDVPVIPVYIDNMWGSLFSFSGGRFFRKRLEGWRRRVGIVFGPPILPPVTAFKARQAVLATGVHAFELRRGQPRPLETIDPELPHFDHPTLGPLTASTAGFAQGDVRQTGHKPGTVGQSRPGVALRVVDDNGSEIGPETEGRLEAIVAGRPDWIDTGRRASIDRDGFVRLLEPSEDS